MNSMLCSKRQITYLAIVGLLVSVFGFSPNSVIAANRIFGNIKNIDLGGQQFGVTSVDINGDGYRDLVSTDRVSKLTIVYNNSTPSGSEAAGTFATAGLSSSRQQIVVGDRPESVVGSDIDKDGDNDIVVVRASRGDVSVFVNQLSQGSPKTFIRKDFLGAGFTGNGYAKTDIDVADFNNDTYPDVVISSAFRLSAYVLLNNKQASLFNTAVAITATDSFVTNVATLDSDNDGDIDIATHQSNSITRELCIYTNNGNGTFAGSPVCPTSVLGNYDAWPMESGDFDGDGDGDLAFGDRYAMQVRNYPNNNGAFSGSYNSDGGYTSDSYAMESKDFDGDGYLDIALTGELNKVMIFLGYGNGSFNKEFDTYYSVGSAPVDIFSADFNNDGSYDLVTVGTSGLTILFNQSNNPPALDIPTFSATNVKNPGISFRAQDQDVADRLSYSYHMSSGSRTASSAGEYNIIVAGDYSSGQSTPYSTTHGDLSWGPNTVYYRVVDNKGAVDTRAHAFVLEQPFGFDVAVSPATIEVPQGSKVPVSVVVTNTTPSTQSESVYFSNVVGVAGATIGIQSLENLQGLSFDFGVTGANNITCNPYASTCSVVLNVSANSSAPLTSGSGYVARVIGRLDQNRSVFDIANDLNIKVVPPLVPQKGTIQVTSNKAMPYQFIIKKYSPDPAGGASAYIEIYRDIISGSAGGSWSRIVDINSPADNKYDKYRISGLDSGGSVFNGCPSNNLVNHLENITNQQQTLIGGGAISFVCNYVPNTGRIEVRSNVAMTSNFLITGPQALSGKVNSAGGSWEYVNAKADDVVEYQISCPELPSYKVPVVEVYSGHNLANSGMLLSYGTASSDPEAYVRFNCTYTAKSGTIKIRSNRAMTGNFAVTDNSSGVSFGGIVSSDNGEFSQAISFSNISPKGPWSLACPDNPTYHHISSSYSPSNAMLAAGGTLIASCTYYDNQPPVADFLADPMSGDQPLTVNFTDQSSDPDGDGIVSRTWDFGDGSDISYEQNPSHIYSSTGIYPVTLTIQDSFGTEASASKNITVTISASANGLEIEPSVTRGAPASAGGVVPDGVSAQSAGSNWTIGGPVRVGDYVNITSIISTDNPSLPTITVDNYDWRVQIRDENSGTLQNISGSEITWSGASNTKDVVLIPNRSGEFVITLSIPDEPTLPARSITLYVPRLRDLVPQ